MSNRLTWERRCVLALASARVRTLLDVWVWGRTPKFLGPRVEIPARG